MDDGRSPYRSAPAIATANVSDVGGTQDEQSTSMWTRWSLSRTALAAPPLMFQTQMSRVGSWLMMRLVLYMLP